MPALAMKEEGEKGLRGEAGEGKGAPSKKMSNYFPYRIGEKKRKGGIKTRHLLPAFP